MLQVRFIVAQLARTHEDEPEALRTGVPLGELLNAADERCQTWIGDHGPTQGFVLCQSLMQGSRSCVESLPEAPVSESPLRVGVLRNHKHKACDSACLRPSRNGFG